MMTVIQKSLLGTNLLLLPLMAEASYSGTCQMGVGSFNGPSRWEDGKNKTLGVWALGFTYDWAPVALHMSLRAGQRLDLERGDKTPETDGFLEWTSQYVYPLNEAFTLLPGAGIGYYATPDQPFPFLSLGVGLEFKMSHYLFLGVEGQGALGIRSELPRMMTGGVHFRVEI
jgi:hypothetical protein